MKARIAWTCPCSKVLWLVPCRARVRKACSKTCPKHPRKGGAQAAENRLTRIMFAHNFSREQAFAYLTGWIAGRSAANRQRLYHKKVGTAAWERSA